MNEQTSRHNRFFDRIVSILAWMVLFSFAYLHYANFWMPLTDEDHIWLLQNSRVMHDGLQMMNHYPQCKVPAWDVPWALLPGRLLASFTHPNTLMGIRLMGMAMYAMCIAVLFLHARFFFGGAKLITLAVCTALLSLGVLPYMMLFTRPESQIFIGIALLSYLVFVSNKTQFSKWRRIGIVVAFFAILQWLYGLHPKVIYLTPAILLLVWCLPIHRRWPRFALIFATLFLTWQAFQLWKPMMSCPDYSPTEAVLHNHTLSPMILWENPEEFVERAWVNIEKAPTNYVNMLVLHSYKELDLPPSVSAMLASEDYAAARVSVYLVALTVAILFLAVFARSLFLAVRERSGLPALGVLLSLAIFVQVITKDYFVYYESIYIFPLAIFILILALSQSRPVSPKQISVAATVLFLIALESHFSYTQFFRPIVDDLSRPIENGFISDRGIIIQGFADYPEREERIKKLAGLCHIPLDQDAKHVAVDLHTYLPLRNTYQPFNANILDKYRWNKTMFLELMHESGSSGVLTHCSNWSHKLRALMTEQEGLCCIGKEEIDRLASKMKE